MHSILIIDNDVDQLDALNELLEISGYSTTCAQNGREALDLLRIQPLPAMILLDLNLPVVNGRPFLDRKRNDPALVKVLVVVISGTDTEQPQGAAAILGENDKRHSVAEVG